MAFLCDAAPQRSQYKDAPAAFPTLCPSGELMPGVLSSHFTFGVRGQEQSRAAPVVVVLQDWDWSWGHCQGRRGRLRYPCLKVPTTRKFLIISAQGVFICQWACFDRGLLSRQAAGLLSCAGRERGKRDLKNGNVITPSAPPAPTVQHLLVISPAASVRTQFLAITVGTKNTVLDLRIFSSRLPKTSDQKQLFIFQCTILISSWHRKEWPSVLLPFLEEGLKICATRPRSISRSISIASPADLSWAAQTQVRDLSSGCLIHSAIEFLRQKTSIGHGGCSLEGHGIKTRLLLHKTGAHNFLKRPLFFQLNWKRM